MAEQFPKKEVPNRLPKRNGKKIHYSTVYRWALKGCRGKLLKTWLIGGIRYTSDEALTEFLGPVNPTTRTNRSLQISAAEKKLNAAGI